MCSEESGNCACEQTAVIAAIEKLEALARSADIAATLLNCIKEQNEDLRSRCIQLSDAVIVKTQQIVNTL